MEFVFDHLAGAGRFHGLAVYMARFVFPVRDGVDRFGLQGLLRGAVERAVIGDARDGGSRPAERRTGDVQVGERAVGFDGEADFHIAFYALELGYGRIERWHPVKRHRLRVCSRRRRGGGPGGRGGFRPVGARTKSQ